MYQPKHQHKQIRPVSDLRNNFADISRLARETKKPVFLTKYGYGDMVILSYECYEEMVLQSEIYTKLAEAEKNEDLAKRYSAEEVLKGVDGIINESL